MNESPTAKSYWHCRALINGKILDKHLFLGIKVYDFYLQMETDKGKSTYFDVYLKCSLSVYLSSVHH